MKFICYDIKPFIYTLLKYSINGLKHDNLFVAEYLLDPNRSRYSLLKYKLSILICNFDESFIDSVHLLYILKSMRSEKKKGIDEKWALLYMRRM